MTDKYPKLITKKLVAILLVLYSITIGVYFKWFYKPIGRIHSSDTSRVVRINQTLESIDKKMLTSFFIISFLLCFTASILILIVLEEIRLYNAPIIEVNAKLLSKVATTSISGGSRFGTSYVSSLYKLNFEIENGEKLSFRVSPKNYCIVLEGNKGTLKYKEGRINRFVGFDLKEIV